MKNNYQDWEFKIIEGLHSEVQKWLNQWRHQFELILHKVHFERRVNADYVIILLSRRKLS